MRRIEDELGVRFVSQSSVRRSGDKVRVTSQLIDGVSRGQVWSERQDQQLDDVFDLQNEITHNVVASIQTSVHLNTIEQPVEHSTRPDLTVWELTMRAWHLLYDFPPQSFDTAETLLEHALALDPESAEANMVLSWKHHHFTLMGYVCGTKLATTAAYALGHRAIQKNDRNEHAHWALRISC